MKIKIFSEGRNIMDLEKKVNSFIEDKTVIDIKQSECMTDEAWSTTITVLYEENN